MSADIRKRKCISCTKDLKPECYILQCDCVVCITCEQRQKVKCTHSSFSKIKAPAYHDVTTGNIILIGDILGFSIKGKCSIGKCIQGAFSLIKECDHQLCKNCTKDICSDPKNIRKQIVLCYVDGCKSEIPTFFLNKLLGHDEIKTSRWPCNHHSLSSLKDGSNEKCQINTIHGQVCNKQGYIFIQKCKFTVCFDCLEVHAQRQRTLEYDRKSLIEVFKCPNRKCELSIQYNFLTEIEKDQITNEVSFRYLDSKYSSTHCCCCFSKKAHVMLSCCHGYCRTCFLQFNNVKLIRIKDASIRSRICYKCKKWTKDTCESPIIQVGTDDFLIASSNTCNKHAQTAVSTWCCSLVKCHICLREALAENAYTNVFFGQEYKDVIKCSPVCDKGIPKRIITHYLQNDCCIVSNDEQGNTDERPLDVQNGQVNDDTATEYLFKGLNKLSPARGVPCSKCKVYKAFVKLVCEHAFCFKCLRTLISLCNVDICYTDVPKDELDKISERWEEEAIKESLSGSNEVAFTEEENSTPQKGEETTHKWITEKVCTDISKTNINVILKDVHDQVAGQSIKGVYNLGMTCYANSIFQVLGQTKDFVENLKTSVIKNRPRNLQLTDNLRVLLSQLNEAGQNRAVDGRVIHTLLQNIFSLDDNFKRYEQNDCFEFLNCLFEKLAFEDEESTSIFQLKTQTVLEFMPCNHYQLCQTQVSKSLLIPMSKDNTSIYSVSAGLKSLLQNTERFGKGILPCKECKVYTKETKQSFVLQKTPDILIIHIGRVKTEQFFFKKYLKKEESFVEYEETLEVPEIYEKFDSLNNHTYRYTLYGVVLHSGSVHGGHYYSYVKKLGTKQWFVCNDSSVSKVDESHVFGNPNAYMLFYQKGPLLYTTVSNKSEVCSLM